MSAAEASAQERDWLSTERRILANTAYSLEPGQWQLEGAIFGAGDSDIFLKLGAAVGLGAGFELSLNLAHYSVGLFNTQLDWNVIDQEHFGLGVQVGFTWGNGKWIWLAPSRYKEVLRGINLYMIPIWLWSSFPVNDWLQFDLGAGYTHVAIIGDLDNDTFLDGSFGRRELAVSPQARVYIVDRLAITLGARLPLWTRTATNLTAATTVADGAFVGIRTAGEGSIPFEETFSVTLAAESPISDVLSISLRVTYAKVAEALYRTPIAPSLSLLARF